VPVLPLTASTAASLRAGLEPVRRRLRALRRARDVAWSLTGAAAGALAGTIAQLAWGGDRAAFALAGALAATVGVAAILALRHRRRPVDLLTAARWAEAQNGLQERLSTALEAEGSSGPVADALRADAARHAARLDPERTVPWRWPRAASGWFLATVVALGVANLDRIAPAWVRGPSPHAVAEASGALRGLAAELAAEAAMSGDGELASLAEALRRMAEAGPAPERREELEALLEEVERRAGGMPAVAGLLEAWRQADRVASEEAGPGPAAMDAAAEAGAGPTPGMADAGAATGTEPSFSRFEAWVDDEDTFDFASAAPAPLGAEVVRAALDPDAAPDGPTGATTEGPAPEGGAAEIIGAAEQSQAGDSALAGRGSQELEGDASSADHAASEVDDVLLAGIERDEGRRIELELPPTTDVEAYDPRAFELGAWRERPEAAVDSDPTPLRYRAAAGKYFLPSQETAASR
jgi:hypothetical protein